MEKKSSPAYKNLLHEAEKLIQLHPALIVPGHHEAKALQLLKQLLENQSDLERQYEDLEERENNFRKEKAYYNDVFNNQPVGLYRIRVFQYKKWKTTDWISSENPPYVMEFASDSCCEIMGVRREDFAGNPYMIADLVSPEDIKSFIKKNEEANKKVVPFRWEGRLIIHGKTVWVRLESLPRLLEGGDIQWTGILYDMTERKMAEDALNESRLKLEEVLEGANVGTLEWNVQTGKIKYNKIWARNLGYTSTEIKIGLIFLGKRGWKVITHPDDIPYAEEMLERHFSGELPYHTVEVRMRHKKGHWVWIRQEGKVKTWTPDGKPLLMYGTHTDISKRKEMELELRNNEEKYRILFADNPQPMLIFDPKSLRILEVNDAFIIHYGYSREDVSSMTLRDITPASNIPEMLRAVSESQDGTRNLGVKMHKKKNNDVIHVEIKSHTIKYRDSLAVHVLLNDVTEQKKAEQALFDLNEKLEERILERTSELIALNKSLQESDVKFRTVTNFTYDWEYWKSPEGKILFMSPSVERITGYTATEFEEDPQLLDKIIHPNDSHIWEKHKAERCHYDVNEKRLEQTFRIVRKDGNVRWIGHVCRCINVDNTCLGVRVSNRDITDKVNAENRLLSITVDIEEQERNRFSSELHDGMGPLLSTIKLYFQWLADTCDADKRKLITEKGNHSIEMAIQTARELARGLSSQYVSDAGYVQAINDFTQRINDTNTIQIDFVANTTERFGGFFELVLYRITTELIKNTLTYANACNIDIRFDYDKQKNAILFSYADNGVGFDWEKIQQERKGLGLLNIQQRVQILKGTIEIKSEENAGMKTVIYFPVEKQEK